MARIGFLTLYATGHLNPSLALARALADAGHEPVFFNLPDTASAVAAVPAVRFVAFGQQDYPVGTLAASMQRTAELSGPAAFAFYVERMVQFFRVSFRELPALLTAESLDLLVVDQVHYAGATLAEHLGLPFVSLCNALLVNREDRIPPPIMLWPYEDSEAAIARNRAGWAAVDQAYGHLLPVVNQQRTEWGLAPYSNLLEDSFSPLAQVAQQPALFDFPRTEAPPTLHLVGHLHDEAAEQDVPFPWDWLDGRPLVYASCGTLQNRLEHVFRAIIEACSPLEAQTVIALGKDALSPSLFGEVPANVKLVPFAPQRALLRRASLCITHAGLNTTLDCLEAGVPAVAIPIASEQPGIAMRLARIGAGVVVPLAELSAASLRAAIDRVQSDGSFAAAARTAAQSLAGLQPAKEAVRILDQVLASHAAN